MLTTNVVKWSTETSNKSMNRKKQPPLFCLFEQNLSASLHEISQYSLVNWTREMGEVESMYVGVEYEVQAMDRES